MLLAAARRRFRSSASFAPVHPADPAVGATPSTLREDTTFAEHLISTLGRGASSCADLQAAAAAAVKESRGNVSELTKWHLVESGHPLMSMGID